MTRYFVIGTALLLTACATAPKATYEAATNPNTAGYTSMPADNGRVSVVYTGAKGMNKEQVAQFALLRAAELTAEAGQEWFAVINTVSQDVELRKKDDLKDRTGGVLTGESAGTGSGAAGGTTRPGNASDSATRGGPSTGGFGGGDVPYQVLERWTPPKVHQTALVIQMGTGTEAKFTGVTKAPEIFNAKATSADIRAKMAQQ